MAGIKNLSIQSVHVYMHACRLISVLESMDNGKSIRESRDCDIPLVARHLYHHSGQSDSHSPYWYTFKDSFLVLNSVIQVGRS